MAKHFINGQWVAAASGQTLPVINPATGESFDTLARGDASDVDRAVAAARAVRHFRSVPALAAARRVALYASIRGEIGTGPLAIDLRSRGITLYLEPKFLYNNPLARSKVPNEFAVPFGKARRRSEGTDLTIVAYGTPVHFALQAADALRKEGKSVEVVDLRSLVPLDHEAVLGSARKTGRVLVAHEDKVHGGFGGEIVSQIQERVFPYLDAPIARVGSTFTPVGFNRILERAVLPNAEKVLEAARKVLGY